MNIRTQTLSPAFSRAASSGFCRKRLFLSAIAAAVLLSGGQLPTASAQIGDWTPIYSGIDYASGKKESPRLMRAFAMRIDLENPNVSMDITAPNSKRNSETDRQTTPDYLDETGVKAAVNAHFYRSSGPSADLIGLAIQAASRYSDDEGTAPWQLRFTSDNSPSIAGWAGNPSGFETAVAGNDLVLENGTPRGDDGTPNPRTVAGVSEDSKYLILVVIDGRQSGWSDGATYKDGGQWAKDFGAHSAINLDGGGSSTMVRDSSSGAEVLNQPSGGSPRSVGSNMGVFSKDINDRLDVVVRGETGKIYWKSFWRNNGGWSGWTDLGGWSNEKPGISSRGPGQLEVFMRGGADDINFRSMHDYGTWGAWQGLGGPIASGVGGVSRSSDRINLVARGTDDTVQQKWWTPGGGWSTFQSLGGATSETPSISSRDANHLDVFIRGGAGDLNWKDWNSTDGWGSWVGLGGDLASGPSAVSRAANRIDVVAREAGATTVMQLAFVDGTWGSWVDLGGGTDHDPGIASWGSDRLDVFITGGGGDVNQRYFNGSWSGWSSLGTVGSGFTAGPEAVGGQW